MHQRSGLIAILPKLVGSALLAAVLPLLPGSASSQSFKQVTVDLAGPTFTGGFPFDVPFLLTGPAPNGVVAVSAYHVEYDKAGAPPRKAGQHAVEWPTEPTARWARMPGGDDNGTATFSLRMPALDAERYYQLRFIAERKVPQTDLERVHQRAMRIIDTGFRPAPLGGLTEDMAGGLRAALVDDLKKVVGGTHVIAPGTVFDPDRPYSAVRTEFNRIIAGIKTPQRNRQLRLIEHDNAVTAAEASLAAVLSSPEVVRFTEHLRVGETRIPALKAILAPTRSALDLVTESQTAIHRLAAGMEAEPVAVAPLRGAWTPEEVQPFLDRYTTTAEQIEKLRTTLLALTDSRRPAHAFVKELLDPKQTIPSLDPNDVQGVRKLLAGTAFSDAQGAVSRARSSAQDVYTFTRERTEAIRGAADELRLVAQVIRVGEATTTAEHDTSRDWYVSADVGLAYLYGVGETVPYSGVNIYFRPINRDAPLSQRAGFWRRFSGTVGVTLKSVKDDGGTRYDLFGSNNLLLGVGYRVSQTVRLGAGGVVLKRRDPDGERTDKELAANPFANISLDIDFKKIPGLSSLFN